MPVYQSGNRWLVSVGSGKDRFRATFETRAEAERVEMNETIKRKKKHLETYLSPEENEKPASGITMRRLFDLAKKLKWNESRAQDTLIRNAQFCIDYLGHNTPVEQITVEKIRNLSIHLIDSGNSNATVNRKLSSLSVMLRIAEDEGWIDRVPRMPRRKESDHRVRFLDAEEEIKVMALCEHLGLASLADFISFAIDTGFRRGEILKLKLSDCVNDMATLHAGSTKSGKARSVPLTARAKKIVAARRLKGYDRLFQDLTESTLRFQWETIRTKLGLTDDEQFVVHMLRHTCASRLAMAGKNATFIMNWMGHSSIMVTQRYMHLSPNTMLEGAEALDNYRQPKVVVLGGGK